MPRLMDSLAEGSSTLVTQITAMQGRSPLATPTRPARHF
jgi:hypothetical protein